MHEANRPRFCFEFLKCELNRPLPNRLDNLVRQDIGQLIAAAIAASAVLTIKRVRTGTEICDCPCMNNQAPESPSNVMH